MDVGDVRAKIIPVLKITSSLPSELPLHFGKNGQSRSENLCKICQNPSNFAHGLVVGRSVRHSVCISQPRASERPRCKCMFPIFADAAAVA